MPEQWSMTAFHRRGCGGSIRLGTSTSATISATELLCEKMACAAPAGLIDCTAKTGRIICSKLRCSGRRLMLPISTSRRGPGGTVGRARHACVDGSRTCKTRTALWKPMPTITPSLCFLTSNSSQSAMLD